MKKKHIGKRLLAIFFALAFCLTLLPMTAMADGEATYEYVATPTESGTYLIVNSNTAGSGKAVMTGTVNDYGQFTAQSGVAIGQDLKITGDYSALEWDINFTDASNFTISNSTGQIGLNSGGYMGYVSGVWSWSNGGPQTTGTVYGSPRTQYLAYSSNSFTQSNGAGSVYFFKKAESTKTVDSVTVYPASKTVGLNGTFNISATVTYSDETTDSAVDWSSGDTSIATVTEENGTVTVTGVATGSTTITATSTEDDTKSASCTITVIDAVAQIGNEYYATVFDAFGAAQDGDTITVLKDSVGDALTAAQGRFNTDGLIIDLNNHTYEIEGLTGSTGTITSAIQLLRNNKITFKNGTLLCNLSSAKFVIQNYCDLTLDNMVLTLFRKNGGGRTGGYTLSNNQGNIVIKDTTINANPYGRLPQYNDGYAMDVCRGPGYDFVNVSVLGNSEINGPIEVSIEDSRGVREGLSLNLSSSVKPITDGGIVIHSSVSNVMPNELISITKDVALNQAPSDGFRWANGTTLVKGAVNSVTVTPETASITAGSTEQLSAAVTGAEGVGSDVIWTSSDESVATVDANGVVTAVAEGEATITATSIEDNTKSGSCTVTVTPVPITGKAYRLVASDKELTAGKNYLIASGDSGDVQLLTNNNGTIGKTTATVEGGVIRLDNESVLWEVTAAQTAFKLRNQGKYLNGHEFSIIDTDNTRDWAWNGSKLTYEGGFYELRYANDSFGAQYTGGTMTGTPVYLFEELDPEFVGHQLVLNDQIDVRFVMDLTALPDSERADSSVSFEVGKNVGATINTTDAIKEGNRYTFVCKVNSLQMADKITATFHYGEGKTVVDEYSVEKYIDYVVDPETAFSGKTDGLVSLVKAVGDYGHYAQIYLADGHGFTVGDGDGDSYAFMKAYTDSLNIEAATDGVAGYAHSFTPGESGVQSINLRLSLNSETALSIRANAPGKVVEGGVTFNQETTPFSDSIAKVEGIKASQLGVPASIAGTVDGNEFSGSASVLSYVKVVLDGSYSSDLKNAAAALYFYHSAVQNYLGN